ncbi:hypothetical protein CPC08DRAFT_776891 [Agrocybe pediades]|nr:hypothetical protein CPC08DRAFT_776891 [Agrocybe pediades]
MSQPCKPLPSLINISHSIVAGGTFNQHIDQRQYTCNGERPGYMHLLKNVATAALHDSVHVVDAPKCHPNTRVAIIQGTIDWALGQDKAFSGKSIWWIKGCAGTGKSAIARSVAERSSDEGLLLGAFFFGATDPTRNHVGKLVATLSYQISIILPEFRDAISAIVEDDPLIFDRSIGTQFFTLISRPLSAILSNQSTPLSTTPCLIIIDGLDECSTVEGQQDLLCMLEEATKSTPLIRFLVCSRPETHLKGFFGSPRMIPIVRNVFIGDDYAAIEDIRTYVKAKFTQIKADHECTRG